ncbi:WG repeat-containing protein [Flammeovirgaceae bacterium SG7u.111]|nr:WG repeat-containing protein [Flammeovirgaceae bacterium SG7u.132]WPO37121.1 WG repeat-containing protein [Flammeovirgaceae bacterium SG7u.111]
MSKSIKPKIILFTLLIFLSNISAYAQKFGNYYPVRIDYKWGAIDSTGNVILQPKYEHMGAFNNQGLAVVKLDKKYGVVDSDGKQVLDPAFDNIRFTKNKIAIVANNGKWGLANLTDSIISPTNFDLIQEEADGYFKVFKDSLLGISDLTGSLICPAIFAEINFVRKPFFFFEKNGKHGMGTIEPKEENSYLLISSAYDSLYFLDSSLVVSRMNNLTGILDTTGQELLPPTFDHISILEGVNQFLQIRQGSAYGIASRKGDILVSPTYDAVGDGAKYFMVSKQEKWGIVDSTNSLLVDIAWKDFELIDDDFILLRKEKSISAIFSHLQKKIVFEGVINNVSRINKGFLEIKSKNGFFIILKSGDLLSQKTYRNYKFLSDDLIAINEDGLWGIHDLMGNLIAPCTYNTIYSFPPNFCLAKVEKESKMGLINKKGKVLLKPIYENIEVFSGQAKGYEKGGGVQIIKFDKEGKLLDSYRLANVLSISLKGRKAISMNTSAFTPTRFGSGGGSWQNQSASTWFGGSSTSLYRFGSLRNKWALYDKSKSAFIGIKENGAFRFIYKFGRGSLYWGLKNRKGERSTFKRPGQRTYEKLGYVGNFHDELVRVNIGGEYGFVEKNSRSQKYALDDMKAFRSSRFITYLNQAKITINFKDIPICDGGRWGFMDKYGKLVIPADYDFAHDFVNQQAIVEKDGKWGVIDSDNNVVIDFQYSHISFLPDSENSLYLLIKEDLLMGYLDTLGRQAIPTKYLALNEYKEGRARVLTSEGWGFINREGEMVIRDTLAEVRDFNEGLAAFRKENVWGFIDRNGNEMIKPTYQDVGNFSGGKTWVKLKNRKGIIGINGTEIIPPIYYRVEDYEKGVARVYTKSKWGLMDEKGKWVVPPKYSKITSFDQDGYAKVKQKNWGIIDSVGNVILKPHFSKIGDFHEGLAYVRTSQNNFRKRKYGFINKEGKVVIKPKYKLVGDFSDSLASTRPMKKRFWGYLNHKGKYEIPPIFVGAENFNEGIAVVYTKPGRKNGPIFINKKLETVNTGSYTPLKTYSEGRAIVRQGKLINYIDEQGHIILKDENLNATDFQYHVAFVQKNNQKWALVDKLCLPLTEAKFNYVSPFNSDKLAKVGILFKYGIANRSGTVIVSPDFDGITQQNKNMFQLIRGDEIGYINTKGEWVWSPRK